MGCTRRHVFVGFKLVRAAIEFRGYEKPVPMDARVFIQCVSNCDLAIVGVMHTDRFHCSREPSWTSWEEPRRAGFARRAIALPLVRASIRGGTFKGCRSGAATGLEPNGEVSASTHNSGPNQNGPAVILHGGNYGPPHGDETNICA